MGAQTRLRHALGTRDRTHRRRSRQLSLLPKRRTTPAGIRLSIVHRGLRKCLHALLERCGRCATSWHSPSSSRRGHARQPGGHGTSPICWPPRSLSPRSGCSWKSRPAFLGLRAAGATPAAPIRAERACLFLTAPPATARPRRGRRAGNRSILAAPGGGSPRIRPSPSHPINGNPAAAPDSGKVIDRRRIMAILKRQGTHGRCPSGRRRRASDRGGALCLETSIAAAS
jgi:hypothetical protein